MREGMATTASRPFREWLQAQLELRGVVGVVDAARVLRINEATMSRYLGGSRVPQRRNVIVLAAGLGLPVEEVQAAADADPGRIDQLHPPPPVQDQLAEIHRMVGELAAAVAAGPLPAAEGPLPATLPAAGGFPDRPGGPQRPVVVRDPVAIAALLAAVNPVDGLVVWIADSTGPRPGDWVRVGDPAADPPALKPYAPGDDVTGVVGHVQGWPRA